MVRIDANRIPAHICRVMANRKKRVPPEQMRKHLRSFCGIFKQKPGEKSVVQELIEERRAEKAKENR